MKDKLFRKSKYLVDTKIIIPNASMSIFDIAMLLAILLGGTALAGMTLLFENIYSFYKMKMYRRKASIFFKYTFKNRFNFMRKK